jgi:gluconolactonase
MFYLFKKNICIEKLGARFFLRTFSRTLTLSGILFANSCIHHSPPNAVSSIRFPLGTCGSIKGDKPAIIGPLVDITPQDTPYEFYEGPVWLADQQFFLVSAWNFSDPTSGLGPPTTILSLKDSNPQALTKKGALRTNGLALDHHGDLVGAVHGSRTIASLKNFIPIAKATHFKNTPFHSPNDLVVRSDGTIYFTDPDYQRDQRTPYPDVTGVYGISPQDQGLFLVDDSRLQPNGITLSPDELFLYVGGGDGKIYRYELSQKGYPLEKTLFADPDTTIDGMSVDCLGNIYATLHTKQELVVYAPSGQELMRYPVGYNITNVAFGGADHKTLLITTAGRIFKAQSALPGSAY